MSQTPKQEAGLYFVKPELAAVVIDHGDGEIEVTTAGGKSGTIHRRQVTHRLRPKAKPAGLENSPRVECWGRMRRHVHGPVFSHSRVYCAKIIAEKETHHGDELKHPELVGPAVHLVEMRDGEVPVSREALERAWGECVGARGFGQWAEHLTAEWLSDLSKALGLPAPEGK